MKPHWLALTIGGAVLALPWVLRQVDPESCTRCADEFQSLIAPMTDLWKTHTRVTPLPYAAPPERAVWQQMNADQRLADVKARLLPALHEELAKRQLAPGAPVYLRAFKESRELELWLRGGASEPPEWTLYRTYPIAALSGHLGPKLAEGDGQTPEGCYAITPKLLNPASAYHLAMNIGYPNALDLHHRRTGSFIMIHGDEVSIGCLAMTDAAIEEIYWLVKEALEAGQGSVPVHLFPFRMTEWQMALAGGVGSQHVAFWRELKPIYDHFEARRDLPKVALEGGSYTLPPVAP